MAFTFTLNGHLYTSDPATVVAVGYRFNGYGYITALANLVQDIVAVMTGQVSAATDQATAAATQAQAAAASAATALAAPGTNATSVTPVTIANAVQINMVIQAGKSIVSGMNIVAAVTASASVNQMHGIVDSYNGATGAIAFTTDLVKGGGTYAAWTLSISGPVSVLGNVPVGVYLPMSKGLANQITTAYGTYLKSGVTAPTASFPLAPTVGTALSVASSIPNMGINNLSTLIPQGTTMAAGGGAIVWAAWDPIANANVIQTSADGGTTWVSRAVPVQLVSHISCLAFGNGKFIVMGADGTYVYSTDGGATWAYHAAALAGITAIIYAGSKWVACGANSAQQSTDGLSWATASNGLAAGQVYQLAYINGSFNAMTTTTSWAYSTDGISWTVGAALPYAVSAVCWQGGSGVGIGLQADQVLYGSGQSWGQSPPWSTGNGVAARSCAVGNGKFLVFASDGVVYASANGLNGWGVPSTASTSWYNYYSMGGGSVQNPTQCYQAVFDGANSKFIFIPYSSHAALVCTDGGLTWMPRYTLSSPSAARQHRSLNIVNGKYVYIPNNAYGISAIAWSNDMVTWSIQPLPFLGKFAGIAYGAGKYVLCAENWKNITYSTDLVNWTFAPGVTQIDAQRYQGIAFNGTLFCLVADLGLNPGVQVQYLPKSADGVTWTYGNSGGILIGGAAQTGYTTIAGGNGVFVIGRNAATSNLYCSTGGGNFIACTAMPADPVAALSYEPTSMAFTALTSGGMVYVWASAVPTLPVQVAPSVTAAVGFVSAIGNGTGGTMLMGNAGAILASTDIGVSWNSYGNLGSNAPMSPIVPLGATKAFALGTAANADKLVALDTTVRYIDNFGADSTAQGRPTYLRVA